MYSTLADIHTAIRFHRTNSIELLSYYLYKRGKKICHSNIFKYSHKRNKLLLKEDKLHQLTNPMETVPSDAFSCILKDLWLYSFAKIMPLFPDEEHLVTKLRSSIINGYELSILAEQAKQKTNNLRHIVNKDNAINDELKLAAFIHDLEIALQSSTTAQLGKINNFAKLLFKDTYVHIDTKNTFNKREENYILGNIRLQAIKFCEDWNQDVIVEAIVAKIRNSN